MRHRKDDKKLSRFSSLRKATMRDLAKSIILYQSIRTTTPKAKAARRTVERLITWGKKGDLWARRKAFKILYDHNLVKVLFDTIAPRFSKINGGYTRILPLGNRRGDNAEISIFELTIKDIKEKNKKPQEKSKEQEIAKQKTAVESKEKQEPKEIKAEEATAHKVVPQPAKTKEKPLKAEKPPPKKFLKGLKTFFKRKRDSQ